METDENADRDKTIFPGWWRRGAANEAEEWRPGCAAAGRLPSNRHTLGTRAGGPTEATIDTNPPSKTTQAVTETADSARAPTHARTFLRIFLPPQPLPVCLF
jgi:hypothetical protein